MALDTTSHIDKSPEHRLKILVVDDDEMSRRLIRLLLVRDNHDVQVVANGLEALEAVKEQYFDVVFMDLQMPFMDGLETSRRIREWENGDLHTYIVALTASYQPERGTLMFEAGIDNYISKPFEVEHVRQLLGILARSEQKPTIQNSPMVGVRPGPAPVLDIRIGTQIVGGDQQTYKELLKDFIHGLPNRVELLERLLEEKDFSSLAREAHNLKGVSSSLGALEISQFADKLDMQSNEGYTDQNRALILDLRRAESSLQRVANDFLEKQDEIVSSA